MENPIEMVGLHMFVMENPIEIDIFWGYPIEMEASMFEQCPNDTTWWEKKEISCTNKYPLVN